MMQSSNSDHQHDQGELHGSSSLPPLPFHAAGSHHDWSQNIILSNSDFFSGANGLLSSSRDFRLSNYETNMPPLNIPMVQDLGSQWATNTQTCYTINSASQVSTQQQTKEEFSDSSNTEDLNMAQPNGLHPHPLSGDSPFDISSLACFGGPSICGRGSSGVVLPTTTISTSTNWFPSSFPISSAMDLEHLDMLASAKLGWSFCRSPMNTMAFLREGAPRGVGLLQQPTQGLSNGHKDKMTTLVPGVTETKRVSTISLESTSTAQTVTKKPRVEARSSFSPFKVRKEKLGDRIAALQQLVAPFGKTDTASVLMEAIGYIKFLQDQVETLSVPYMRSSGNKKLRTLPGGPGEEREEQKPDLRSRGLCLVPLSCTSYVTNDNGGIWSPPNFRGGT